MDTKFPTLQVAKAALLMPLENVRHIITAFGMMVLLGVFSGVVVGVFILFDGIDTKALKALPWFSESVDLSSIRGADTLFAVLILPMFVGSMLIVTHIFNYWVRLAALGPDHVAFATKTEAFKVAVINTVKFFLIGIVIGVVLLVFELFLGMAGLGTGKEYSVTVITTNIYPNFEGPFLSSIILIIVYCGTYSIFSENLTRTALRTEGEGFVRPYKIGFSGVLIILYTTLFIPAALAASAKLVVVFQAIKLVFGLYLLFAIPAAHGLRYRVCVIEKQTTV